MDWKFTETYRIFVSPLCLVPCSLVLLVTKYSRFWIVFKIVFCSYPHRHSVQLLWNVFRFSPIPIVTKYLPGIGTSFQTPFRSLHQAVGGGKYCSPWLSGAAILIFFCDQG